MSRLSRIVVEGMPHHVIQRGNRRQKVFFCDEDKRKYLTLLVKYCKVYRVAIWAYCLMDNHVHLVLAPSDRNGLAKAVGQTHWWYTLAVNKSRDWRGYLWQGRFKSFVLHDSYLRAVIRYVETNPVRANITAKAELYPWSSAQAHVLKRTDTLLSHFYLLDEIKEWSEYLNVNENTENLTLLRKHQSTGRPLGDTSFLQHISYKLGVDLIPQKPGPKKGIKCVSPYL